MYSSKYDKASRKRILLYVDLLVMAVFFVMVGVLVRDAYLAGIAEATAASQFQSVKLWHMARGTAAVLLCLAWVFVRFFKEKLHQLDTPWLQAT